MNSRFIIVAILIMIKVIGVVSHARANFLCHYKNTDYEYGYDSNGLNEHGQLSILRIAQDSACNKKINDFLKSKGIF